MTWTTARTPHLAPVRTGAAALVHAEVAARLLRDEELAAGRVKAEAAGQTICLTRQALCLQAAPRRRGLGPAGWGGRAPALGTACSEGGACEHAASRAVPDGKVSAPPGAVSRDAAIRRRTRLATAEGAGTIARRRPPIELPLWRRSHLPNHRSDQRRIEPELQGRGFRRQLKVCRCDRAPRRRRVGLR